MNGLWLTIDDVCRHFGKTRPTVQSWLDKGALKSKDLSSAGARKRNLRVHVDWLREFEQKCWSPPKRVQSRRKKIQLKVKKYSA